MERELCMKKLCVASLMAALLICLLVEVTLAQSVDSEEVLFCGDLTAADCARLEAIPARMATLTSGTSQNQIRVYGAWAAQGLPELSLSASSEFTFVIDPDDLARMVELSLMPPAELAADQDALAEAIRLPTLVDRVQTVTVDLSPEFVQNLADTFDVVVPTPVSFQMRVVNQVLYIRLADFAFLGVQPSWVPEWLGIEVRHLLNSSINAQLANPDFGVDDAAAIQSALVPPGTQLADALVYHVSPEQVAAYTDFMRLTAQGIQDSDGTLVTIFATEWDIPRYVAGPLFAEQMDMPEPPNPTSRLYANLATIVFDGLTTVSQQSVGVNDSLLYAVETDLVWALGLPGGTFMAERPTLGVEINLHNRNLDDVPSIAAPTGAFVPPLNFIFAIVNLLTEPGS
jgi:hypothetical protein